MTRLQLTERFARDEERQLLAVVHDLIESGLVFRSGSGARAVYRAATDSELATSDRAYSNAQETRVRISMKTHEHMGKRISHAQTRVCCIALFVGAASAGACGGSLTKSPMASAIALA